MNYLYNNINHINNLYGLQLMIKIWQVLNK